MNNDSANKEIKKSTAAENLMQLMSFTANKARELSEANSVLGEKMEFDGVTVIPVSKISAGFAGGGASFVNAEKKKSQAPSGSGAKVSVTPMTFLVISDGKVSLMDIQGQNDKDSSISKIIEQIKSLKRKKQS